MKKLMLQAVIWVLLAPMSFAIEAVSAVHGTISRITPPPKRLSSRQPTAPSIRCTLWHRPQSTGREQQRKTRFMG